jgi:enoyl-CoA hydratase/carnithine racemase
VTFDNPPLNLMGPEFVLEFREIIAVLETDQELRVAVFDSAVEGFFLNHSDFNAKLKDSELHASASCASSYGPARYCMALRARLQLPASTQKRARAGHVGTVASRARVSAATRS